MNKLRKLVKRVTEVVQYERLYGWQVGLNKGELHGLTTWHFSALLIPPGRGSTEQDWKRLGQMVTTVQKAAGITFEPKKLEASPNAVQHFAWVVGPDGSPPTSRAEDLEAT